MNRISKVLADTTSKMMFRTANISAVTEHSSNFRTIELTGDALKNATWSPGDKVQVRTVLAGGPRGPTPPSHGTKPRARPFSLPTPMAPGPDPAGSEPSSSDIPASSSGPGLRSTSTTSPGRSSSWATRRRLALSLPGNARTPMCNP